MTLSFSYSGGEGHDVTIQWYRNGVALVDGTYGDVSVSGATTTSLTIDPVTPEWSGGYYAVVTDNDVPDCVLTTEPIYIDNCTLAISQQTELAICFLGIDEQPENPLNVEEGAEAALSFTYTSFNVGTLTVQWFKDDVALEDGETAWGSVVSGATTTDLTITNAQTDDDGDYYAVVTDSSYEGCEATTNTSTMTVIGTPSVPTPDAWWRMDEIEEPIVGGEGPATDRADQVAGSTLVLLSGTVNGYEDARGGAPASAFFNAAGRLATGAEAALAYTTGNSISFNFWFKAREVLQSGEIPNIVILLDGGTDGSIEIQGGFNVSDLVDIFLDGPMDSDFIEVEPLVMTPDQWYMWTLVYDGATGLLHFYIDTALVASTATPVTLATAATGTVDIVQGSGATEMLMSQVGLWMGYALTGPDITTLYAAGAGTTCCPIA